MFAAARLPEKGELRTTGEEEQPITRRIEARLTIL